MLGVTDAEKDARLSTVSVKSNCCIFVNLQALLCYWFSSNCVSLVQASFLKIPKVRQALNIPAMVSQKPETRKPIIQSVKESKFLIGYLENSHIAFLFLHAFVVLGCENARSFSRKTTFHT